MSEQPTLSADDVKKLLGKDRTTETLDELRESIYPNDQRQPTGPAGWFITLAAAAICLFTLWMAFHITLGAIPTRALLLAFMVPLALLLYPALTRWKDKNNGQPMLFDYILATVALTSFVWAIVSADRYESRVPYVDPIETADIIFGTIAILAVFEAARRTVGMTIVWINVTFIFYALAGSIFPGPLEHGGTTYLDLIETLYMATDGIFNFITGIMATFVFTFLTFGTFLRVSGGDRVFTDLALSVAGHRRGGPAKVAVISSALMGTLSGSTVSNVVTTGSLTIPMMKRLGFKPYEAAAIETTASLGGALTPPLMGTAVFIMASFAGVPLVTILMYSIIPALLYFTSLYFYVDVKARKKGLSGLPRNLLPKAWTVIKNGGHIFIPIFVLIFLLIERWTPFLASSACVVGVFVISFVRKNTRMTPPKILIGLEAATRVTMTVASLGASAALIYGVITVTGLLVKMTSIILALAGGSLFIGIVLIALMSYVMGMGLPVTAAYVLLAALGSPALQDLGLPVLAAHLIILWFSQDSTITPPICMTAFVGARIAKAPPMKTGWQCVLMAKALYIIPFVFAYGSLLDDSLVEIFFDAAMLFLFFASMPIFVEGYYSQKIGWVVRILIGLSGLGFFTACLGPMAEGYLWLFASTALFVPVMVYERNRAAGAVAAQTPGSEP